MRKRLMAIVMTLMLGFTMVPYSAFAGTHTVTETTTGCIAINNAVNNDEFAAYKVIDITYDAATKSLTHAFNTDFQDYFTSKSVTIKDFAGLVNGSDTLNDKLSGIPKYIIDNSIPAAKTGTVVDGKVAFTDLAMGEYLIIPTSTASVYQLMLQKLEPQVKNSAYILDDVEVNAKKTDVSVTKAVDKDSVTRGEALTYTITADIPNYMLSATNKAFEIVDSLDTGLILTDDPIEVKFSDATVADAGMYSLDINSNKGGFKFSVSDSKYNAEWKTRAEGNIKLIIKYKATIDKTASTDIKTFENTVNYTYHTLPLTGYTSHTITKSAVAKVESYTIKVVKFDAGDNSKKLSGAKFDLYRTLKSGEDASAGIDIPGTATLLESAKKGKRLERELTTDSDGIVLFKQYEANGNNYDYYLVETQAPAGYNLLQKAVQINFTAAETTGGIFTVQVENSTGFQLPITGDTGTILMSVIGLVLMGGAVVLLLLRKRKASRAE